MAPSDESNEPSTHAHSVCPAASVLDAGQASHDVDANDAAMVPGGQNAQLVAPELVENVPGAHIAHSLTFRKLPAGQAACAVPFRMTTKPVSTGVHCVTPGTELYVFCGQLLQTPATTSW